MKGERIIAELLSIAGLMLYLFMVQHLYAEMLHEPDRSWFNRGRAWWMTRRSRARIVELSRVWNLKEASAEPTPGE